MPKLQIREITLYALLGALLFALKMAMAGLPNIEPISLLVMVYAVVFGRKSLWAIYIYVLLECLTFGINTWTAAYLYIWLILYCFARLLRHMDPSLSWAILSAAFGLCFGLLCTPLCLLSGGWGYAVSWWLSGIPYDLLHGAGNFAMALLLFHPCRRLLEILHQRYEKGAPV